MEKAHQQQLRATSSHVTLRGPRKSISRVLSHFFHVCAYVKDTQSPLRVRLALILRSARALLFLRAHAELARLPVYEEYVVPAAAEDRFHHLSRRFYLAQNLSLRQRVECLLTHYRFEETSFSPTYRHLVYCNGGLMLWNRRVGESDFALHLVLADRYAAEGDLSVMLTVDGERMHCIDFSWVCGKFAGLKAPIVPFLTANQGRWRRDQHVHEKFNAAFPLSAPNFFCYAALQGLAQAIGMTELIGVSSRLQVCFSADDLKHFENAYDVFWEAAGGVRLPRRGYLLPVPQPMKPLSEVASKHRKRAASRRAALNEISEQAFAAIAPHFQGRCRDGSQLELAKR